MKLRVSLYVSIVSLAIASMAYAQGTSTNPDQNKPLEITADESLEWHRNDLFFKAKKNVRASQGGTTLISDILVAKYRESKTSNIDIHTIQATGRVQIVSANSKAYGDKAIYSVDKGYAVMTGNNLKLVSDDQTVTARDKFQYWVNKGRLEAIGKAVAMREGDRLEADKLIAIFDEKNGKRTLRTLQAIGNVVITTPTEVLTGEKAIYQAKTDIAEISENVKITKGPNTLEGAKAQVNLKTNISKIFGSKEPGGGRVKGVFFPRSESKP